jgi:hypothetical protein
MGWTERAVAAAIVVCGVVVASSEVTVDETKVDLVYDGHGGLSAGASSRLLSVPPPPPPATHISLRACPFYPPAAHWKMLMLS